MRDPQRKLVSAALRSADNRAFARAYVQALVSDVTVTDREIRIEGPKPRFSLKQRPSPLPENWCPVLHSNGAPERAKPGTGRRCGIERGIAAASVRVHRHQMRPDRIRA